MDAGTRLLDACTLSNANYLSLRHKKQGRSTETAWESMEPTEVLLVVQFLNPDKRDTKAQELIVRACQPLTALRDANYCLQDVIAADAGLSLPSAFFCIEDVFYSDMRRSDAKDLSSAILHWNRKQRQKWNEKHHGLESGLFEDGYVPEYQRAKMEQTCFLDFSFQIAVNYVYMHQGGCKHVFQIMDMRLLHPTDVQNGAAYPVVKFQQKFRHRKCCACGLLAAKKVVRGDAAMAESPAVLCADCYYCAHYGEGGDLLQGDYEVFDYYHE